MRSPDPTLPRFRRSEVEQRTTPRAQLFVQVECQAAVVCSLGKCENISETGMLVKTPDTFAPSTVVQVRFTLPPPGSLTVEAKGAVVRVEPGKAMAIRFLELSGRHHIAIAEFVEQAMAGGI